MVGWFYPFLFGESGKLLSICETELLESDRSIGWPVVSHWVRDASEAELYTFIEGNASLLQSDQAVSMGQEREKEGYVTISERSRGHRNL